MSKLIVLPLWFGGNTIPPWTALPTFVANDGLGVWNCSCCELTLSSRLLRPTETSCAGPSWLLGDDELVVVCCPIGGWLLHDSYWLTKLSGSSDTTVGVENVGGAAAFTLVDFVTGFLWRLLLILELRSFHSTCRVLGKLIGATLHCWLTWEGARKEYMPIDLS